MANKKRQPPQDGNNDGRMPLGRQNYILMLIGLGVIALGFMLMMGGGSDNPATDFNYTMFSFRRITLAPIVVVAGFVFEIYAIMKRDKKEDKR